MLWLGMFIAMAERILYRQLVLTKEQRISLLLLVLLWVFGLAMYWWWWLDPSHHSGSFLLLLNTLLFFYITGLPAYSFFFALRMCRPLSLPLDPTLRLAMVVTKAPSEPWHMVRSTLQAMLDQDPPHDTWLADEDPSIEVLTWCQQHDVKISCRKGVSGYHNPTWPRRRACKEGNLAYFYDHYGYHNYDVVVQLDADHQPLQGYLQSMASPFADPLVGYVAAPSICDRNRSLSWSARGRLFFEAFLHGPLQMGYGKGWQPICIGSHYAVRTSALKEIGGLGPELAEDLSTSLLFITNGWNGAFADRAFCSGLGPDTFQDCMIQEFQWSRSITALLLRHSHSWMSPLPSRLKLQLWFVQLFYPIRGSLSLAAVGMSSIALVSSQPWVNLDFIHFIQLNALQYVLTVLPCLWLKSNGFLRPNDIRILSWETWLFEVSRGPWILLGVLSAVVEHLAGLQKGFRITRKSGESQPVPFSFLFPYVVLALFGCLVALLVPEAGNASGYYLLILLASSVFALVCLSVVLLGMMEARSHWWNSVGGLVSSLLLSGVVACCWWFRRVDVTQTLQL